MWFSFFYIVDCLGNVINSTDLSLSVHLFCKMMCFVIVLNFIFKVQSEFF